MKNSIFKLFENGGTYTHMVAARLLIGGDECVPVAVCKVKGKRVPSVSERALRQRAKRYKYPN